MLSESQQIEKKEKIKKAVDGFLDNDISIDELSKKIDIPSSTIQRYLHDVEYIVLIYGSEAKEKLIKINEKLK